MGLIYKPTLWNTDINWPESVVDYIDNNQGSFPAIIKKKNALSWMPPIFLYYETRDKQNYVHGHALYGGYGSKTTIVSYAESRELLAYHIVNETDKLIDHHKRGEILDVYCKIEFCLSAMYCIMQDVYKTNNNDSLQYFKKHIELLTNDELIKKLYSAGLLSAKAKGMLIKAKNIRNTIAHQYLPTDDYGITKKDLSRYGTHVIAIDHIINAAWFYLLNDYSKVQESILPFLSNHEIK